MMQNASVRIEGEVFPLANYFESAEWDSENPVNEITIQISNAGLGAAGRTYEEFLKFMNGIGRGNAIADFAVVDNSSNEELLIISDYTLEEVRRAFDGDKRLVIMVTAVKSIA